MPCFFFVSGTWDSWTLVIRSWLHSKRSVFQMNRSQSNWGLSKKKNSVGEFEKSFKNLYFLHRNLGIFWRYSIVKLFFWEAQCRRQGALSISGSFSSRSWCQPAAGRKLVGNLLLSPKNNNFSKTKATQNHEIANHNLWKIQNVKSKFQKKRSWNVCPAKFQLIFENFYNSKKKKQHLRVLKVSRGPDPDWIAWNLKHTFSPKSGWCCFLIAMLAVCVFLKYCLYDENKSLCFLVGNV